jgi:hypothetical protein
MAPTLIQSQCVASMHGNASTWYLRINSMPIAMHNQTVLRFYAKAMAPACSHKNQTMPVHTRMPARQTLCYIYPTKGPTMAVCSVCDSGRLNVLDELKLLGIKP